MNIHKWVVQTTKFWGWTAAALPDPGSHKGLPVRGVGEPRQLLRWMLVQWEFEDTKMEAL